MTVPLVWFFFLERFGPGLLYSWKAKRLGAYSIGAGRVLKKMWTLGHRYMGVGQAAVYRLDYAN